MQDTFSIVGFETGGGGVLKLLHFMYVGKTTKKCYVI